MQTQNTVPSTQNNITTNGVTTSKLTKWVTLTICFGIIALFLATMALPGEATTSSQAKLESLQRTYDNEVSRLKDIEQKRDTLIVEIKNLECEMAGEKLKNWDSLMLSQEKMIELSQKANSGCGIQPEQVLR